MRIATWTFTAFPLIGALMACSLPQSRQTIHTCRPSDAQALEIRHYARMLASSNKPDDVTMRAALKIPQVTDTNTIVVVTGPSTTCNKAGQGFADALKLSPSVPLAVYVILVDTVYLVEDPATMKYDWHPLVVLKKNGFKYLATSFS